MRPAAPTAARTITRRLASMAGCELAASTVLAAFVPALLAAFSQVPVRSCQAAGFRPCSSISVSGMPAGTACWMVVRSFCIAFGASALSVAL